MYLSISVSVPESAVEPHSLATMLPVRHSSTRRLNWQLGESREEDIIRTGGQEQINVRTAQRNAVNVQVKHG